MVQRKESQYSKMNWSANYLKFGNKVVFFFIHYSIQFSSHVLYISVLKRCQTKFKFHLLIGFTA